MTYTKGPWTLHNLVNEQGGAMTPDEVGDYIADRIRRTIKDGNGSNKYLFIETEEPNELTICDLGNGPNGMMNGLFIVAGEEMLSALLAVERAEQLSNVCEEGTSACEEWLEASNDAMEKVNAVLKRLRAAGVIEKAEGRTA